MYFRVASSVAEKSRHVEVEQPLNTSAREINFVDKYAMECWHVRVKKLSQISL